MFRTNRIVMLLILLGTMHAYAARPAEVEQAPGAPGGVLQAQYEAAVAAERPRTLRATVVIPMPRPNTEDWRAAAPAIEERGKKAYLKIRFDEPVTPEELARFKRRLQALSPGIIRGPEQEFVITIDQDQFPQHGGKINIQKIQKLLNQAAAAD